MVEVLLSGLIFAIFSFRAGFLVGTMRMQRKLGHVLDMHRRHSGDSHGGA